MGLSGFHNLLLSSLNLDFKICLWASYVTKVFQKEDSAHRGNKEVHSIITQLIIIRPDLNPDWYHYTVF